jgi:hypothetical protein
MDFKFPKPNLVSLETINIPKDVAIVSFHQATNAGMPMANTSYQASFEQEPQISVLVLAKWIRAFYENSGR